MLESFKSKYNLAQMSVTELTTPVTIHFYEKWLNKNYQGEMQYLQTHLDYKKKLPLFLFISYSVFLFNVDVPAL